MSEETDQKPKGKAIEITLEDDFEPTSTEIKNAQNLARQVSPFLLNLLESEIEE